MDVGPLVRIECHRLLVARSSETSWLMCLDVFCFGGDALARV